MKITFEFDTEKETFDYSEFNRICQSLDMASCIWDILQQVREWDKYDPRGSIPAGEVFDTIHDIVSDNNINIDKIYS